MQAARRRLLWLGAAALAGCAGLPGTRTAQVGARRVEWVHAPGAAPTVVFENGLGGHMAWWQKVLPELAGDAACFAYNRPGIGQSTEVATPRDGAHTVAELRALLQSQGVPPPYVLVGHSLGGLYMQLFARQHPDEVAALVLVDSTHPQQTEGAGAMDRQSAWVRGVVGVLVTGSAKQELDLVAATGAQVLALPPLQGKPVFVLSAEREPKDGSDAARHAHEKRVDIARLHPGSVQTWVDSGHAIPLDKPEAVVAAVRAALAASRATAAT